MPCVLYTLYTLYTIYYVYCILCVLCVLCVPCIPYSGVRQQPLCAGSLGGIRSTDVTGSYPLLMAQVATVLVIK